MKQTLSAPSKSGDFLALAAGLEEAAKLAPPGYSHWASIAVDGARAARVGDLEATRAACTSCHDQYRAKYKGEMRKRALP